jgi:hypothetical protein
MLHLLRIPYTVPIFSRRFVDRSACVMATKFFGILPLTRYFKFEPREGMYTTLMMSTRSDLQVNLSVVRPGQPYNRSGSIHRPSDSRHWRRDSTHSYRADLVPATFEPLEEDAELILLGGRNWLMR